LSNLSQLSRTFESARHYMIRRVHAALIQAEDVWKFFVNYDSTNSINLKVIKLEHVLLSLLRSLQAKLHIGHVFVVDL